MSTSIWQIVGLVVAALIGSFSKPLYDKIEEWFGLLAKLPTWVKPLVILLLTYGITQLSVWLQISLNTDITKWVPNDVQTLLAALFAMVQHIAQQQKTTTAAIAANKIAVAAITSSTSAVPVTPSVKPPLVSH